jgi:beta-fructofuranosidase
MIAWTEQGVAVAPGGGDDGVWSGSIATGPDGGATMFYTSVTEPDFCTIDQGAGCQQPHYKSA